MDNHYSTAELLTVFLARELKDGEVLRVGVAMPVAEAAVRLAHLTHGPNMELVFLGARMNVAHLETIPMPAFGWDRFVEKVLPRVPQRRWGTPEDFGGIAVYLASPASSYHTGDVITIDGGYAIF